MTRVNVQNKVDEILQELLRISNFNNNDYDINDLNPVHIGKLTTSIELGEKITFVIPAFPAKSANRKKTLSSFPDMGEVEALKNLNDLAAKISRIYEPGAEVFVCSDGRVFSDLVGVKEDDVSLYKVELKNIVQKYSFKNIYFFDLEDEYSSNLNFDQMRYRLEKQFSKNESLIRDEIKNDMKSQSLFNGIHRFLKEDFSEILKGVSKNQINRLSKTKAYKVVLRSNAWSELVERKFPKGFRLSIHPQDISSVKFPVRLLAGDESWGTPWHRVPVKKGGKYILMKHHEALNIGAILNTKNDYRFFELRSAL